MEIGNQSIDSSVSIAAWTPCQQTIENFFDTYVERVKLPKSSRSPIMAQAPKLKRKKLKLPAIKPVKTLLKSKSDTLTRPKRTVSSKKIISRIKYNSEIYEAAFKSKFNATKESVKRGLTINTVCVTPFVFDSQVIPASPKRVVLNSP
jgi:hypothetical protein